MFTAHLPAGYVLTSRLRRRWPEAPLWLGCFAAVVPDLDLLYFYFIDHRRTLHHHYPSHLPLVWLALGISVLSMLRLGQRRELEGGAIIFLANIGLHLALDTFVGRIPWLAPFSWRDFNLFEVPATHRWWLWNFVFHWSFLAELAVWLAALAVWRLEHSHVQEKIAASPG